MSPHREVRHCGDVIEDFRSAPFQHPTIMTRSFGRRGPYFGLRGSSLNVATIVLVVCPAFTCFGYNQAVAGGVLTLKTFAKTFPLMDTVFTVGAQAHYNSTIQG